MFGSYHGDYNGFGAVSKSNMPVSVLLERSLYPTRFRASQTLVEYRDSSRMLLQQTEKEALLLLEEQQPSFLESLEHNDNDEAVLQDIPQDSPRVLVVPPTPSSSQLVGAMTNAIQHQGESLLQEPCGLVVVVGMLVVILLGLALKVNRTDTRRPSFTKTLLKSDSCRRRRSSLLCPPARAISVTLDLSSSEEWQGLVSMADSCNSSGWGDDGPSEDHEDGAWFTTSSSGSIPCARVSIRRRSSARLSLLTMHEEEYKDDSDDEEHEDSDTRAQTLSHSTQKNCLVITSCSPLLVGSLDAGTKLALSVAASAARQSSPKVQVEIPRDLQDLQVQDQSSCASSSSDYYYGSSSQHDTGDSNDTREDSLSTLYLPSSVIMAYKKKNTDDDLSSVCSDISDQSISSLCGSVGPSSFSRTSSKSTSSSRYGSTMEGNDNDNDMDDFSSSSSEQSISSQSTARIFWMRSIATTSSAGRRSIHYTPVAPRTPCQKSSATATLTSISRRRASSSTLDTNVDASMHSRSSTGSAFLSTRRRPSTSVKMDDSGRRSSCSSCNMLLGEALTFDSISSLIQSLVASSSDSDSEYDDDDEFYDPYVDEYEQQLSCPQDDDTFLETNISLPRASAQDRKPNLALIVSNSSSLEYVLEDLDEANEEAITPVPSANALVPLVSRRSTTSSLVATNRRVSFRDEILYGQDGEAVTRRLPDSMVPGSMPSIENKRVSFEDEQFCNIGLLCAPSTSTKSCQKQAFAVDGQLILSPLRTMPSLPFDFESNGADATPTRQPPNNKRLTNKASPTSVRELFLDSELGAYNQYGYDTEEETADKIEHDNRHMDYSAQVMSDSKATPLALPLPVYSRSSSRFSVSSPSRKESILRASTHRLLGDEDDDDEEADGILHLGATDNKPVIAKEANTQSLKGHALLAADRICVEKSHRRKLRNARLVVRVVLGSGRKYKTSTACFEALDRVLLFRNEMHRAVQEVTMSQQLLGALESAWSKLWEAPGDEPMALSLPDCPYEKVTLLFQNIFKILQPRGTLWITKDVSTAFSNPQAPESTKSTTLFLDGMPVTLPLHCLDSDPSHRTRLSPYKHDQHLPLSLQDALRVVRAILGPDHKRVSRQDCLRAIQVYGLLQIQFKRLSPKLMEQRTVVQELQKELQHLSVFLTDAAQSADPKDFHAYVISCIRSKVDPASMDSQERIIVAQVQRIQQLFLSVTGSEETSMKP